MKRALGMTGRALKQKEANEVQSALPVPAE
jgi:hypothetical protein